MGTLAGSRTAEHPRFLAQHLTGSAQSIVDAALVPATQLAYKASWDKFELFCREHGLQPSLPISKHLLVNFLTSLFEKGLAPSTLFSHASAISYFHKIADLPDPTNSFLVKKFLKGAKKLRQSGDGHLPITQEIMHKLLGAVTHVVSSYLEHTLLLALFLVCFHCFLRVGEVCLQANPFTPDPARRCAVHEAERWPSVLTGDHSSFQAYAGGCSGCFVV
jgi:hypothetical protein